LEIFGIGLPELLLIAIVALIVVGPDRLPEAARAMGKAIGDFRRAIEPARNAWADVSREITAVANTGLQASGNPWEVHPLAEGLSDEERARFFASGEIPEWKQIELEKGDALRRNGAGLATLGQESGELPELEYPMPHGSLTYHPTSPFSEPLEELDYPPPRQ
jgi:Tat protein translocase TatB subunit